MSGVAVLLQVLLLLAVDVLEHCVASVRQLKGITATYRMTAKGPPVRHSHYVAGTNHTADELYASSSALQRGFAPTSSF